ncbi:hypothetical protein B0A49_08876 [Cryomyces minteri]|uniref:Uncharacterized protein n=1 Tax=Cryomyces minteri TaxID=331657 RepID=A0A4V5NE34_9PEZI|nr:hypothetical protein B0A49_08876 [Cryomyces minteri]
MDVQLFTVKEGLERAWDYLGSVKDRYDTTPKILWLGAEQDGLDELTDDDDDDAAEGSIVDEEDGEWDVLAGRFNTGVAFNRVPSVHTVKETESLATTSVTRSHAVTPSTSKVTTSNSMTTSPSGANTRVPNVVDGKIEDSDWSVISNDDGEDGEWELLEEAMD